MNRHQRRFAAKKGVQPSDRPPVPLIAGKALPPGRVLRAAASILLSSWVLRRVHNPQVLSMLRQVAIQADRQDAARQIEDRISRKS